MYIYRHARYIYIAIVNKCRNGCIINMLLNRFVLVAYEADPQLI